MKKFKVIIAIPEYSVLVEADNVDQAEDKAGELFVKHLQAVGAHSVMQCEEVINANV